MHIRRKITKKNAPNHANYTHFNICIDRFLQAVLLTINRKNIIRLNLNSEMKYEKACFVAHSFFLLNRRIRPFIYRKPCTAPSFRSSHNSKENVL